MVVGCFLELKMIVYNICNDNISYSYNIRTMTIVNLNR